jgi:serine/threonine protein kinase
LVLEFAPGGTLEHFLEEEPTLSRSVAIRVMLEMAEGLKQIHGKGVQCGDIHGGNILLMGDPETWMKTDNLVKWADFGPGYNRNAFGDVKDLFDLMDDVATESSTILAQTLREAFRKKQDLIKRDLKAEDLVAVVKGLDENLGE